MMSRKFKVKDLMVAPKVEITVRILDVDPELLFWQRQRRGPSGIITENVPYYRLTVQDNTGACRATVWNGVDWFQKFQGALGSMVTVTGQCQLSKKGFDDLSARCLSVDPSKGGLAVFGAPDDPSVPSELVVQKASSGSLLTQDTILSSLLESPLLKRPASGPEPCCARPDLPFCLRRPGVRHKEKCPLCAEVLSDTPVCGMTGKYHAGHGDPQEEDKKVPLSSNEVKLAAASVPVLQPVAAPLARVLDVAAKKKTEDAKNDKPP